MEVIFEQKKNERNVSYKSINSYLNNTFQTSVNILHQQEY